MIDHLPTRMTRHRAGVPVFEYRTDPYVPPLTVIRSGARVRNQGRHIHDFPALWFQPVTASVWVVAPGHVLDPDELTDLDDGMGVLFDPSALGEGRHSPWPTWRSHPLLFPFSHGRAGGLLRLELPDDMAPQWISTIEAMERESRNRRSGHQQAALAHLTLLLIDVARLADDVVADLCRSGEPLLAEAFTVIDRRYREQLSLRDVARDVGLTPGHLTTVVRRRTGRTVGEWITDRRMSEARRLLSETMIPIQAVAERTGYTDPGYFGRLFRRVHGISPRQWRAGG